MVHAFWKEQLSGFEPTAFPDLTGRSGPARSKFTGHAHREGKIDINLKQIRDASESLRVSLEALLYAAWAKVLAAYLGELEVCLGCVLASDPPSEGVTPSKAHIKPLRIQLGPAATNAQLVQDVHRRAIDTATYPPPTREDIESICGSEVEELFDTVLLTRSHHEDLNLVCIPLNDYAVSLELVHDTENDTLSYDLHCRSSLVLPTDIHHVKPAFEHALISIIHASEDTSASWTSEASRSLMSTSNLAFQPAPEPFGFLVHSVVEHHAKHTPSTLALDYENETGDHLRWTYSDLNSIGNRIANLLREEHSLQIEESVPICVSKSPAFYACVLGVLKAGGVFTPFSNSPSDRKKFMLDELHAKVVLCVDGEDMNWCTGVSTVNITQLLSDLRGGSEAQKADHGLPDLRGSNLAYQMYTSGSTGRPKAVSVEHRNAVQTASICRGLVPWTKDDRMLQYAAPSFDMCYYDTFLAWSLGICLCSTHDEVVYNDLTGVINRLDVSLLGLTPSVALTLDPAAVPSVKWLYCIGEAMPQSLVDAWEGRLFNSYGPTEAAQMVTLFPVSRDVKSAVIGQPFSNTSFTVLLKNSQDVAPVFGLGELCIGGAQVARGYYANEERTKQAFITRDGSRMYKTGDNVRMLSDGKFEFVGRTDDQIKIRGQRVELGEINVKLKEAHDSIANVSTQILKVSDQSRDQLVAFLVLQDSASDDEQEEVRKAAQSSAQDQLPPYMVPKLYLFIDKIPLSAAGKVDKRALTKILRESAEAIEPSDQIAVGSDGRQLILEILSKASGSPIASIGDHTTIYQLGLDSISAIHVSAQLKQAGFSILPSELLSHPTIAELAPLLSNNKLGTSSAQNEAPFDFNAFDDLHRATIVERLDISRNAVDSVRPCSPLQAGMIAQSIHSTGEMYFNHLTYQLPEHVDHSRLLHAWDALIERHEILRTGFSHLGDAKFQLPMVTYRARATELPVHCSGQQVPNIQQWRAQMVRHALKELHRPPWQVLIAEDKMYFSAHHALYDAQVLDIIARDLNVAYAGGRMSPSPSFEPHLARILRANGDDSSSRDFWRNFGEKAVVSKFPVMTSLREETKAYSVASKICAMTRDRLTEQCRSRGVTLQASAQAAWGMLLSAYLGEESVTFGTVLSGRITQESEDVVFPCITTVPTSVNCGAAKPSILKELMRFNAEVQQHQFASLKQIQRWTGHADSPLFDTLFTYQKRTTGERPDDTVKFLSNELTIDYPVSVELEHTNSEQLEFRIYYRLDHLPAGQAQSMAEQLDLLLTTILAETPNASPPSVKTADPRLYSITPAKVPAYESDCALLHHFVESGAKAIPKKIALEYVTAIDGPRVERQTWSFQELDREGNKMANLLRCRGVSQGSLVAVCFDKCPEASFAMLGILKAGCGFLALDPGAPTERKKFIMNDSKAAMLVTKDLVDNSGYKDLSAQVLDLAHVDMSDLAPTPPPLDRAVGVHENSYCLYTSGTTGTPKGCVVTHENVVQAMLTFQRLYKWSENSRWLAFASYHFDVSVMEQYWSWSVGMCCVVASRDLVFEDIAGTIRTLNISHIDLTPSLARVLDPADVPSLAKGVFVTGGEMLKNEIIERWGDTGAIHNAYGPTEATIGCTMYCGVPKKGRPSNIGPAWPVAGTYVVNPADPTEPVLRGAVGELCVVGKLVAKGYLHRPALTEERFINIAGQRAYRTGDLVRVLHDGCFDFLGRADDQVKLRGQRLEIGEINSVIKACDETVLDVSTQLLKHPQQQKEQLVSFVVLQQILDRLEKPSSPSKELPPELLLLIRSACVDHLPGFMVPTHILPLTSLPLSANNKADGKQLKSLYGGLSLDAIQRFSIDDQQTMSETGSTEDQQKISHALARILGLEPADISSTSSFFELGLDSISVIGFARFLKAEGCPNVSTSMILRNASLSRLSKALTSTSKDTDAGLDNSVRAAKQNIVAMQHRYLSHAASFLSVNQSEIDAIARCTPLQLGIITRSLESARGLYFATFSFDLKQGIDLWRLKEASQRMLGGVQILRTRFVPTDDGYIQVALRTIDLPWREEQVPTATLDHHLDKQYESWWRANQDAVTRPFEIIVAKTEKRVAMSLHLFHACYDGNSLPLLMEKLLSEYHGKRSIDYGPAFFDCLPQGPLRQSEGAETFWMQHLHGLSQCSSRSIAALASEPSHGDLLITSRIEHINGFEECRRLLGVTHQAIVQACWTAVLQSTMALPLVMGTVVSGRAIDYDGAEKVIGPLFNTTPFLLAFTEKDTWKDVIKRCHNFNSAALPHQHTPLRDITKWCKKHQLTSENNLFDNLLVFQKETPPADELEPIWEPLDDDYEADYPLSLEVVQTLNGGFNVALGTQANMSDEATSRGILEMFETALRQAVLTVNDNVSSTINVPTLTQTQVETGEANDSHANGNGQKGTNGLSNDAAHGHCPNHVHEGWTPEAISVRDVVATLADVKPDTLHLTTSILELGLDSIDAVKLSSRLKRSAGVQIPVSAIMRSLTIAKIDAAATSSNPESQSTTLLKNANAVQDRLVSQFEASQHDMSSFERVLPCTPLQEGMVYDMTTSDFKRYFNHDVMELGKDVDVGKLRVAWDQVVKATPILRTRFIEVADPSVSFSVAQAVLKCTSTPWREGIAPADDDFGGVQEDVRRDVQDSHDTQPLLRLTLLTPSSGDRPTHLVLSIAHAMYDGWSLGLLHEDVRRVYYDSFQARPSYEPALFKMLDSSSGQSETFWRDALTNISPIIFPQRSGVGAQDASITHRIELTSDISLEEAQAFCQSSRNTIASLAQTAWACVLASYTHQLDVAFGQVLSGRDDEDANEIAFPTMNTIVSRAVLHGSREEMVHYMQENASAVTEHQHFPLRKALALADAAGKGSLFNTLFIYQKAPTSPNVRDEEKLYTSVGGSSDVEYPVCVEAEVAGDRILWRCACKDVCLDSRGAEELLRTLDSVLKAIVRRSREPTVDFSGGKASVCGLSPFEEKETAPHAAAKSTQDANTGEGDEQLTAEEEKIRDVVAKVARRDPSDVHKQSSLLALGLDSISAIKVSSLLRKQSIKLSVTAMLKAGTIAKIAQVAEIQEAALENNTGTSMAPRNTEILSRLLGRYDTQKLISRTGIAHDDVEYLVPATAGQVFMLSRWQQWGLFYPTLYFDIYGCNDLDRLQQAWKTIIRDASILRTIFIATGDSHVPILQASLKSVPSDIVSVPRDQALDEAIEHHPSTQTSNIRSPITIFAKCGKNSLNIAIHLSHALYDGFVLPTLVEHLRSLLRDPTSILPSAEYTFPSHIAQTFPSSSFRKAFWTDYLADLHTSPLPTNTKRMENETRRNVHVVRPHIVTGPTMKKLNTLTRTHGLTIQSLFLAVFAGIRARLSSAITTASSTSQPGPPQDVILGIYTANRHLPHTDTLFAPTIGFVPLRVRNPTTRPVMDIARDIQDDLRAIGEDEKGAVGLWEIDSWLGEAGADGLKVDVWVNILKGWEDDTGNALVDPTLRDGEEGGGIRIEGSEHGAREEARGVTWDVESHQEDVHRGLLIRDNAVKGVYGDAVDLEATVHAHGVSIGVVVPEEMLDAQGAGGVIEGVAAGLGVLGEA